jgi:hypothetical protein
VIGLERAMRSDIPRPWDYDPATTINPEPAEVVDIFEYFTRHLHPPTVHSDSDPPMETNV